MSKYALCVGINDYPGSGSDLSGCVNDMNDWAHALDDRDFTVHALKDSQATGDAIIDMLGVLIHEVAKPGDLVAFCYSGHGTWVPDMDGDEPDHRDEALCPYDYRTRLITDDELYRMFTAAHREVRCVMISDSCHSGSVNRLAAPIGDDQRRVRFLPPAVVYGEGTQPGTILLNGEDHDVVKLATRALAVAGLPARGKSRASALLLAGCKDTEYSYDASFAGRPNGAFSRVAIDALLALPTKSTYREWYRLIRHQLPNQAYPQTPQLAGGSHQKRWTVL